MERIKTSDSEWGRFSTMEIRYTESPKEAVDAMEGKHTCTYSEMCMCHMIIRTSNHKALNLELASMLDNPV